MCIMHALFYVYLECVFRMCIFQILYILKYWWGDIMRFKIEKTEYVNRTFRITKELADTLSKIAQSENISVNELVVQCCNYAIANMENTEESTI